MLDLEVILAERGLDLAIRVAAGRRVGLLGENGSGKSSLLSVAAGLVRPDAGRAVLHGRTLFDYGTRPPTWIPAHRRGIALLSQEPLLFGHLTVLENVAFGPRSQGRGRRTARGMAREQLEQVEALDLASRMPRSLSGGQGQRVALARALAADPALLLLDEPMSAMDVGVRHRMRQVLRRVLVGRTAIIATHDVLDAALLTDDLIVLDHGKIVEQGPTSRVLAHPRSPFTAKFAGLNLVLGKPAGPGVVVADSGMRVTGLPVDGPSHSGPEPSPSSAPGPEPAPGTVGAEPAPGTVGEGSERDRVAAVFAPRSVSVFRDLPHGSPRNAWAVTVSEVVAHGGTVRVRGGDLAADVLPASAAEMDLTAGARVFFVVKASEVSVFGIGNE